MNGDWAQRTNTWVPVVDMSDMFVEVSLIMWESLMILALLGQKLWDQTSFGLKTGRSKNRHVGQFLTQKTDMVVSF